MRTTLDLDNDILHAAKQLAARRGTTAGRVISDLVRAAMSQPASASVTRNGFPVVSGEGAVITDELVQTLLDDAD